MAVKSLAPTRPMCKSWISFVDGFCFFIQRATGAQRLEADKTKSGKGNLSSSTDFELIPISVRPRKRFGKAAHFVYSTSLKVTSNFVLSR